MILKIYVVTLLREIRKYINKTGKMQTVTIDILDKKAVKLLQDLELLKLIKMRREKIQPSLTINWVAKYKGAMTKQSLTNIDSQINQLRSEWE
jgi:hypothetical protein